jgi:hypothetical protein
VKKDSSVAHLISAIIAKFPRTLQEPTDIESLTVGEQALTSNRTKLATIPIHNNTVVIKKKISQEPESLKKSYKELKRKYDELLEEVYVVLSFEDLSVTQPSLATITRAPQTLCTNKRHKTGLTDRNFPTCPQI